MKKLIISFMIMVLAFMFLGCVVGCAGMPKLFEPPKPYCTPEEQKDSLIYKYLNPGDAKFLLMLGMAAALDNNPKYVPKAKKALDELRLAVESGITYDALKKAIYKDFGNLAGVVISEALENFKGVNIPLKVCDKRLTLGAIDKLLELVSMAKAEYIFNLLMPLLA